MFKHLPGQHDQQKHAGQSSGYFSDYPTPAEMSIVDYIRAHETDTFKVLGFAVLVRDAENDADAFAISLPGSTLHVQASMNTGKVSTIFLGRNSTILDPSIKNNIKSNPDMQKIFPEDQLVAKLTQQVDETENLAKASDADEMFLLINTPKELGVAAAKGYGVYTLESREALRNHGSAVQNRLREALENKGIVDANLKAVNLMAKYKAKIDAAPQEGLIDITDDTIGLALTQASLVYGQNLPMGKILL